MIAITTDPDRLAGDAAHVRSAASERAGTCAPEGRGLKPLGAQVDRIVELRSQLGGKPVVFKQALANSVGKHLHVKLAQLLKRVRPLRIRR